MMDQSLKDMDNLLKIGAVLAIGALLFFGQCSSPSPRPIIDFTPCNCATKDTVILHDTVTQLKRLPIPVFVEKAPWQDSTSRPCDSIRYYVDTLRTTPGLVEIRNKVQGQILEQQTKFEPLPVNIFFRHNQKNKLGKVFATVGVRFDQGGVGIPIQIGYFSSKNIGLYGSYDPVLRGVGVGVMFRP